MVSQAKERENQHNFAPIDNSGYSLNQRIHSPMLYWSIDENRDEIKPENAFTKLERVESSTWNFL